MGLFHSTEPQLTIAIDPSKRIPSWFSRWSEPIDHIGHLVLLRFTSVSILLQDLVLLLQIRDIPLSVAWSRIWNKSMAMPSWLPFWQVPLFQLVILVLINTVGLSYVHAHERKCYDEFKLWIATKWWVYTGSARLLATYIRRRFSFLTLYNDVGTLDMTLVLPSSPPAFTVRVTEELPRALPSPHGEMQQQATHPEGTAHPSTTHTLNKRSLVRSAEVIRSKVRASIRLLHRFCFKLINGMGNSEIVEFLSNCQQQLMLYFATFSRSGRWIAIEKIRTDLYEWEKADDEERKKIIQKFHQHCARVRKKINKAAAKLGVTVDDLFEQKMENNTSWWRLASWCHVEDLTLLDRCKEMLIDLKKQQALKAIDPVFQKAVTEVCEQAYVAYKGDFLAVHREQWELDSWYRQPLQESIQTFVAVLRHLASEAQQAGDAAQQEADKVSHRQREVQLWEDLVLCYAHVRLEVGSRLQESLDEQCEYAACRSVTLSRHLDRKLEARNFVRTFLELMSEQESWKPSPRMEQAWRWTMQEDKG